LRFRRFLLIPLLVRWPRLEQFGVVNPHGEVRRFLAALFHVDEKGPVQEIVFENKPLGVSARVGPQCRTLPVQTEKNVLLAYIEPLLLQARVVEKSAFELAEAVGDKPVEVGHKQAVTRRKAMEALLFVWKKCLCRLFGLRGFALDVREGGGEGWLTGYFRDYDLARR